MRNHAPAACHPAHGPDHLGQDRRRHGPGRPLSGRIDQRRLGPGFRRHEPRDRQARPGNPGPLPAPADRPDHPRAELLGCPLLRRRAGGDGRDHCRRQGAAAGRGNHPLFPRPAAGPGRTAASRPGAARRDRRRGCHARLAGDPRPPGQPRPGHGSPPAPNRQPAPAARPGNLPVERPQDVRTTGRKREHEAALRFPVDRPPALRPQRAARTHRPPLR